MTMAKILFLKSAEKNSFYFLWKNRCQNEGILLVYERFWSFRCTLRIRNHLQKNNRQKFLCNYRLQSFQIIPWISHFIFLPPRYRSRLAPICFYQNGKPSKYFYRWPVKRSKRSKKPVKTVNGKTENFFPWKLI